MQHPIVILAAALRKVPKKPHHPAHGLSVQLHQIHHMLAGPHGVAVFLVTCGIAAVSLIAHFARR